MAISSLSAESRRVHLRELVAREGSLDLTQAAEVCGVSEMTIRRDLAELEREGLLRRVRGGAVAVLPELFERRKAANHEAKSRIASKLTSLFPSSGFVAMDASSTLHCLAQTLTESQATVFTTGVETFHILRNKVGRAIISGGEVEAATGALVGPVALRGLQDFCFDRSFISPSGLDSRMGATESTLEGAEVKRMLRRRSQSVVVAADSTKLSRIAPAVALEVSEIDLLVTELDPADPALDPYRGHVELL
ncbi:MAG: DeoR/GlpR transcriptional regulator [Propionibacteriaceae bacterium]|nr:DeoR/GlpR transcriptional regulator [Propionibacteriaceae bacterium]